MISTFSFTEVSYYSLKEELSEEIWRNNACLDLPKGAKWFLKGVKSPSLRIQLAPLERCWCVYTFQCENMICTHNATSPCHTTGGSDLYGFRWRKVTWRLHGFSPKRQFEYEQFGIIWNFPSFTPLPKLAEMNPQLFFLEICERRNINEQSKTWKVFVGGVVRGWRVQRCGCGSLENLNSSRAQGSMGKCGPIQHTCIFDE